MRRMHLAARAAALVSLCLVAACGSDSGTGPGTPLVASIVVTPNSGQLDALAATVDLSAQARDGTGTPVGGVSFVWTSSDNSVATVSQSGQVTAVKNGGVIITAAAHGHTGTAAITVGQAVSVAHSAFVVDPGSAPADGSTPVTVSVTLQDRNSNPVAGQSVTIQVTGGAAAITQPTVTNASGQTAGTFTSDVEGTRTVAVWVGAVNTGTVLDDSAEVEFIPLDACPDENGDGICDSTACDAGLSIAPADAVLAAAAMGICATVSGSGYGLVSAVYARANGSAININQQIGVLGAFGSNVGPQEGGALLALSSGRARALSDAGACGSTSCAGVGVGAAPSGFPQASQGCSISSNIYDDVALTVTLRAPANARGFAFRSKYYTFDYPDWVCGSFRDQFVVLMSPAPTGALNGNVAFDANGTPISVNADFIDVCSGCSLGTAQLAGTGFDTWAAGSPAGATAWLRTTTPVTGRQEFTLRFIIWDTGDQALDSTVLLDGFQWLLEPVQTATSR
jgi:hypothetical protein